VLELANFGFRAIINSVYGEHLITFQYKLTQMANRVYILGGAQTDFSQNWHRQGLDIADLLAESVDLSVSSCDIDLGEVQSAHVGNFVGELFCGQGQLGGLLVQKFPELTGIPVSRHEAACASGSMAIFAAMRDIEAGYAELSLVSGIEMMKNVDGTKASDYLGAAAWIGHEAEEAQYPWVYLFSEIRDFYQERYGVKDEHLAHISKINYKNAQNNPNAQTRNCKMRHEAFTQNDEFNPIVEGKLRKSDCGRITDGRVALFLASESYTRQYAVRRGLRMDAMPYIKGWGHRTAPITLSAKLEKAMSEYFVFPELYNTVQDGLNRANMGSTNDLDAIETHDCFTISEYIALEHFGLTQPGEAWQVIESGEIEMDGSIPVNPSGGLIGAGHPVGATGVRMMLDGFKQVTNQAGDYQVEGARNVGLLNIGGSFTTVASFVVGI